jgi:hypothetical protein
MRSYPTIKRSINAFGFTDIPLMDYQKGLLRALKEPQTAENFKWLITTLDIVEVELTAPEEPNKSTSINKPQN